MKKKNITLARGKYVANRFVRDLLTMRTADPIIDYPVIVLIAIAPHQLGHLRPFVIFPKGQTGSLGREEKRIVFNPRRTKKGNARFPNRRGTFFVKLRT